MDKVEILISQGQHTLGKMKKSQRFEVSWHGIDSTLVKIEIIVPLN